jgi:hypothetical protein
VVCSVLLLPFLCRSDGIVQFREFREE